MKKGATVGFKRVMEMTMTKYRDSLLMLDE
jgi:hypothetical protein